MLGYTSHQTPACSLPHNRSGRAALYVSSVRALRPHPRGDGISDSLIGC